MKHTAKAGVYAGKLFCESGFDVGKDGIAALTADKDDFAGGGYGDGSGLGNKVLVLQIVLHGLLLADNIGFQCGLYLIGLALGRLHDGNGVAAHHHAGNAGGKGGVLVILQVQQGHQDVPDLLVQLVGLVLGAVTVNGGKLAVLALGKDHHKGRCE